MIEDHKKWTLKKVKEKINENYFCYIEKFMNDNNIITKENMYMTNKRLDRLKKWKEK